MTGERDVHQALFDAAVGFVLFMVLPVAAMRFFAETGELVARVRNGSAILLCGVVPLLAYAVWRREALPFRLRPRRTLVVYVLFALAWIPLAMVLYPYLVRRLGFGFHAQETVRYYATAAPEPWFPLILLVTLVAAPVAEEVFFRGFLFRAVEQVSSPPVAVVLTSVLFGMVHEPSVQIPVGILGLCFGYLRFKTGGIGSSILAHVVHNGWNVAVLMTFPDLVELVYDR